jgi:hypothetical protein
MIINKLSRLSGALVMVSTLVMPFMATGTAQAATEPGGCISTVTGPRNADVNSIVWDGAYTKDEWLCKVHNGDGHNTAANIQHIYFSEGRGITEANFKNTVDGYVTKEGDVYAGGKLVATGAKSIGRTYKTGSTQSGTVWERSTQISFLSERIDAFVNMDGGTFHYFILKACGNAGSATPKPTPTPTPTPTPSPTPVQSFTCDRLKPSQPNKDNDAFFHFDVERTIKNVTLTGFRFTLNELDENGKVVSSDTTDTDADKDFFEQTFTEGTWQVQAQVKTSAGITAVNEKCSAKVVITKATPTPTPTPSPTPTGQVLHASLPDTGAESIALGAASGITALGYAGRAYLRSRKSVIDALRRKR